MLHLPKVDHIRSSYRACLKANLHLPVTAEFINGIQGLQKGGLSKICQVVGIDLEAEGCIVGIVLQGLHTQNIFNS